MNDLVNLKTRTKAVVIKEISKQLLEDVRKSVRRYCFRECIDSNGAYLQNVIIQKLNKISY